MDDCSAVEVEVVPQCMLIRTSEDIEIPDDLFETPCLKKMRIHGKQPDPNRAHGNPTITNRANNRSAETVPLDTSSDDDANMTKADQSQERTR